MHAKDTSLQRGVLHSVLKKSGGFSLIEVLVSLSIFTVVVTISVGSLMTLIAANSRAQNTQAIMTNISYALDSMTREIRTGADYFCGAVGSLPVAGVTIQNCTNGGPGLAFNEGGQSLTSGASSRRIAYRLSNGSLQRRLGNGDGDASINEASDWLAVTSPDVVVTDLRFHTTGVERGDADSPTVTIYLKGKTGEDDGTEAEFNIQTTVVQQLIDI